MTFLGLVFQGRAAIKSRVEDLLVVPQLLSQKKRRMFHHSATSNSRYNVHELQEKMM